MTGTSLDAIDVAACQFPPGAVKLLAFESTPIPEALQLVLRELATAPSASIDLLARAHFALAREYSAAVLSIGKHLPPRSRAIRAIGMHGQTIRHLPTPESVQGLPAVGATLQLGSGAALAALTGIDVVSDFRSADVALGGQGAPLVPMFDYEFLRSNDADRLVVNIGGIANVTWLPRASKPEDVVAFDSGPGNMLLDAVCQQAFDEPFDRNGERARQGTVDEVLLSRLLEHSYFSMPPPKSTGRELFGENFLREITHEVGEKRTANDLLATLTELTARSIAESLNFVIRTNSPLEIVVSGGGALNGFLLGRIEANVRERLRVALLMEPALTSKLRVAVSDTFGVSANAKESIAFAFFAKAFLEELPVHLPHTTGASKKIILGSLSKGSR